MPTFSGSTIAVGLPEYDDGKGRVQVYSWVNEEWKELGTALDGDNSHDHSGLSVTLSSDGLVLAVGEPHYDLTDSGNETTTDAGSVRLYRYDPTSKNWTQIGSRINGTDQLGHSGYSVALSKMVLLLL